MEQLTSTLMVFGLSFVVLVGTLLALLGLEGTCAGRCDESGRPECDFCPKGGSGNDIGESPR